MVDLDTLANVIDSAQDAINDAGDLESLKVVLAGLLGVFGGYVSALSDRMRYEQDGPTE